MAGPGTDANVTATAAPFWMPPSFTVSSPGAFVSAARATASKPSGIAIKVSNPGTGATRFRLHDRERDENRMFEMGRKGEKGERSALSEEKDRGCD